MEHLDYILDLLRCPQTQEPLTLLVTEKSEPIKSKLNSLCLRQNLGIKDGMVTHAVVNQSKTIAYPVIQGIFGLIPALGLPLTKGQLPSTISGEKRVLVDFYNDFGWTTDSDQQHFKDAVAFEDLRLQTESYRNKCHRRVNKNLPEQGQVLLDCASGPVQIDEYLSFSDNFAWRLCVDLSINALLGAKKRLGAKGIYVMGDITRLPIKDNTVDACVSLHTVYHIPQQEQTKAIAELVRTTKPGSTTIIVYSWGAESLVFKKLMQFKDWFDNKKVARAEAIPDLYFHAHSYEWYQREIEPNYDVQLKVWRSLEKEGLSMVQTSFGEVMLLLLYGLEQLFPKAFGKWGVCPMFVITK